MLTDIPLEYFAGGSLRRHYHAFTAHSVIRFLALVLVLNAPFARPAQVRAQRLPRVTWSPARPVEGTVIRLAILPDITDDSITTIAAMLAGESLHFDRDGSRTLRALGAIPLHAAD